LAVTAVACAPAALALLVSPTFWIAGVCLGFVALVFGALAIRQAVRGADTNIWLAFGGTVAGGVAILLGASVYGPDLLSTSSSSASAWPATPATGYTPTPAATPAPVIPVPLGPAKPINARTWQLIAKNPAAHVGERVIVFGHVTQFDSATGTTGFRADLDGVAHQPRYGYVDYPTNSVLTGDESQLANLVQGDLFTAETTVGGAYTYQTTIGGQMTVPALAVTKLTITGSVKR
jgi:hypothetical protein